MHNHLLKSAFKTSPKSEALRTNLFIVEAGIDKLANSLLRKNPPIAKPFRLQSTPTKRQAKLIIEVRGGTDFEAWQREDAIRAKKQAIRNRKRRLRTNRFLQ